VTAVELIRQFNDALVACGLQPRGEIILRLGQFPGEFSSGGPTALRLTFRYWCDLHHDYAKADQFVALEAAAVLPFIVLRQAEKIAVLVGAPCASS